tara:strand:- start:179 stop:439 length:261 start_codon:yes stop_codon:yes gene_type:complete
MSDDGNRFDDDKIIDITDYVSNKKTKNELDVEDFSNSFMSMINQNLIDRQKKASRERFTYFMINFLLLSQFFTSIAICLILVKLYS